jgi:hypothetical protein
MKPLNKRTEIFIKHNLNMAGKFDPCDPKESTSMRHQNCHTYCKDNGEHFSKTTKEILKKM